MSAFEIFSDGAADIPKKEAQKYHITIIPFYVSLDQKTYQKEIEELSLDTFYQKIHKENIFPKTSLPSVQDYINAFTPALEAGKDILCFTITDTLSGSFQSANSAKEILKESYPHAAILIENSWAATGSQYLIVREAARMAQAGHCLEQVHDYVEKTKQYSRIFFVIGTLDYLEKGGRIGKVASVSGNILSIKPLIVLKNGEISKAGIVRSRKKAMLKLAELTKNYILQNHLNETDFVATIGITDDKTEIPPFQEIIEKTLPSLPLLEPFQIGATIATHTGPMTLGICIVKKFEAYLKEQQK